MGIESIRNEYNLNFLLEKNIKTNPFEQFKVWLNDAINNTIQEPTAMSVSTIDENGFPQTRIVLLKSVNSEGFTFFTNYNSNKGKAIKNNARVTLHFFWPQLERQVRITGFATKTSSVISDEYFHSRPIESQISAVASEQSAEILSRDILENKFEEIKKKYINKEIPRPENWGGYLVKPVSIEFWQGRANRLHDRIIFNINNEKWEMKRLAP